MYIDVFILVILLIIVVLCFRRFSSFVYSVAIIDIFLRILAFIRDNVPVPELKSLISKYFSSSIPAIIGKYTNGILYTIIMWIFVFIYMCFLFYVVRTFIHKKK